MDELTDRDIELLRTSLGTVVPYARHLEAQDSLQSLLAQAARTGTYEGGGPPPELAEKMNERLNEIFGSTSERLEALQDEIKVVEAKLILMKQKRIADLVGEMPHGATDGEKTDPK